MCAGYKRKEQTSQHFSKAFSFQGTCNRHHKLCNMRAGGTKIASHPWQIALLYPVDVLMPLKKTAVSQKRRSCSVKDLLSLEIRSPTLIKKLKNFTPKIEVKKTKEMPFPSIQIFKLTSGVP